MLAQSVEDAVSAVIRWLASESGNARILDKAKAVLNGLQPVAKR